MSASKRSQARQFQRVLQFIHRARSIRLAPFGNADDPDQVLLIASLEESPSPPPPSPPPSPSSPPPRQMLTTMTHLQAMESADLIAIRGQTCTLTVGGIGHLRRNRGGADLPQENAFANQHRQLINDVVTLNGERQNVRRNLHESPLSRLKAHRGKDGSPWLSDAAYNAGERLRQDFTHAQLMPSVTSNWNAAMGGARRKDGQGGKTALSDSALDARQRFNQALAFVGPDLSNVLIDVCCYLKGLQQVEREQGWPSRSAKLMLRTGLGLLARFYGTEPGSVFQWAGRADALNHTDLSPSMDGG